MKKVLVGLSGGIDSAVSAYLLKKQGYHVEGVFMKNWSDTTGLVLSDCPWLEDRRDALRVAAFLDIPLHTLDFEKEYTEKVMEYFYKEYAAGRTPNPDVMCNKEIKFKLMYDWAMQMGFDYLATGHYAKIDNSNLYRSTDEFKDQTYFIYNVKKEQLPHLLFPLGGFKKDEVKKLGSKLGLPNAGRKESMGICFVGKIRLKEFLEQKLKPKPGNIVDLDGNVLGTHQGLWNFTLGQRHGIELPSGPWYVAKKDMENNTLTVTKNPHDTALKVKIVGLAYVNWLHTPVFPFSCKARYRHQGDLVDVTIKNIDNKVFCEFKKNQIAVSAGQSIVLYSEKKQCLGGGVIM